MALNDQIQNRQSQSQRSFIFKEGIRFRHLTCKADAPILIKILPSFNPEDPNPQTSWLPFALSDGAITDWAKLIYINRFIGHGKGFGSRRDILSMKTFGEDLMDPVEHLINVANQMPTEFGYLVTDVGEGKNKLRRALSKPSTHLVANIWQPNQPTLGVQIGVFAPSATDSLIDAKSGLIFQRNNVPESVTKQNYLLGYAVGDMTHPSDGPALLVIKGNENGDYSKYRVQLAVDNTNRVMIKPVGADLMAQRYNMASPETFVDIPTEEEIVTMLVHTLNMRGPAGHHEYALLKQAFPQHRIPDPPTAPAAMPSVPGAGFGNNPAASAPPVPAATNSGAPAMPGVGSTGIPNTGVVGGTPPIAAPPVVPQGDPVPAATPVPATTPAALGPAAIDTALSPVDGIPAAGPLAPGDVVPGAGQGWQKDEFLNRLRASGK